MSLESLSRYGRQMSQLTGVRAIMKDIIETLRSGQGQTFINLSAGNPVVLPEVEQLWRDCTADLLSSSEYGQVVGRYGTSQGYEPLIAAIIQEFQQRYGWSISDRNILITPGSQSLYFLAANAFGGWAEDGSLRKILLPLSPDYTGYGGVCLEPQAVVAVRPQIERLGDHRFKYRPDFENLQIGADTGMLLFSRPCNPTGNVISDAELERLATLAAAQNVPVFVDSAYAPPFPGLNFTEMTPYFGDNIVHCLSLSKAGLPGERLGIAIGPEPVIQVLEAFQTNLCIHSSRYGQAIAARAIASGRLTAIAETVIRPYYAAKFARVERQLDALLPDSLPWRLHQGEGGIFAWLWLEEAPLDDWQIYQQLKQAGVIVVPGSSFFPGLREDWAHTRQCLRISLAAEDHELDTGMERLATTVQQIYRQAPIPA
ncbi:valine--pyruvate transaminase [Synechococcus elongatus]|uniref:Valine--pyruvate transaminase n=1 Tax=Synechococcus elongatus PCC 11802 TaxID=2283154 RepID=A0AAT9JU13_SYNEL|nr:valine--pyruvate transaminase [Synechococcus elongatus]QFZ91779.1 valine--pyruvate transaminase [Synechococcus elongatus PCC 11802]